MATANTLGPHVLEYTTLIRRVVVIVNVLEASEDGSLSLEKVRSYMADMHQFVDWTNDFVVFCQQILKAQLTCMDTKDAEFKATIEVAADLSIQKDTEIASLKTALEQTRQSLAESRKSTVAANREARELRKNTDSCASEIEQLKMQIAEMHEQLEDDLENQRHQCRANDEVVKKLRQDLARSQRHVDEMLASQAKMYFGQLTISLGKVLAAKDDDTFVHSLPAYMSRHKAMFQSFNIGPSDVEFIMRIKAERSKIAHPTCIHWGNCKDPRNCVPDRDEMEQFYDALKLTNAERDCMENIMTMIECL